MTLQELQKQVLQLPISERWQLVEALLTSLQQETDSEGKPRNLSRLRGITKTANILGESQFCKSLEKFRQEQQLELSGIEPEIFADVRDSSPGREVSW
jgi:hypothetical protein